MKFDAVAADDDDRENWRPCRSGVAVVLLQSLLFDCYCCCGRGVTAYDRYCCSHLGLAYLLSFDRNLLLEMEKIKLMFKRF